MANSIMKLPLSKRTLQFGSSFAAGAMMLSRMNRSELSRYDDLVTDLCCLPTSTSGSSHHRKAPVDKRRTRWTIWTLAAGK
ncbi:MAG: hypothetical protein J0H20_16890 [Rhizobiales bacterium]|nr:hypothetical protein [Hyphomicrobiales bacterium]